MSRSQRHGRGAWSWRERNHRRTGTHRDPFGQSGNRRFVENVTDADLDTESCLGPRRDLGSRERVDTDLEDVRRHAHPVGAREFGDNSRKRHLAIGSRRDEFLAVVEHRLWQRGSVEFAVRGERHRIEHLDTGRNQVRRQRASELIANRAAIDHRTRYKRHISDDSFRRHNGHSTRDLRNRKQRRLMSPGSTR